MEFKTKIDVDRCKECGLCISVCPKKIISFSSDLNTAGFHPIKITDIDKCIGCAFCATICPDVAIEIEGVAKDE